MTKPFQASEWGACALLAAACSSATPVSAGGSVFGAGDGGKDEVPAAGNAAETLGADGGASAGGAGALGANGSSGAGGLGGVAADLQVCRRTGNNCLSDVPVDGPFVDIEGSCEERSVAGCLPASEQKTAQSALNWAMVELIARCGMGTMGCPTAALSVYFDGECATRFVAQPPELGECVRQILETERFDCAAGLDCGASGLTGGCG